MSTRLRRLAQALAVATLASLLALLAWRVATQNEGGVAEKLGGGKTPPAPNFTFPRLDRAGTLELASLRGKAVVINFWASWCAPCEEELPLLEQLWRKYEPRGAVVLGVATRDARKYARGLMRRSGVTYPNVHDGSGDTWSPYGITALPETFFVDRRGKVIARIAGAIDENDVEAVEEYVRLALRA